MVLEDFLFPKEAIKYKSYSKIRYLNEMFELYLTDQRVIAFKQYGLFSKKDKMVAERFKDIGVVSYGERGRISKTGIITIKTKEKYEMKFEGKTSDMRAAWKELEKIFKILKTRCKFCGAPMVEGSLICPECRKIQR